MPSAASSSRRVSSPPLHYTVSVASLGGHRWAVQLRIARPAACQRVSLPVWIPGSYLVREFARHLNGLNARQGRTARALQQVDKCTWDIHCDPAQPLVLHYEVYAFDASVRTAWLDAQRGFFNGTSLLLRVHGQEDSRHTLSLPPPSHAPDWQLATAMTAVRTDERGFGLYTASSYEELVDHPVEMGAFWSGSFTACGVPHRFVVAGAPPSFDGERLLRDTQRICEAAIRFWHGAEPPPHRHYVFMLNAVHDGYGGLEHRASTALICTRTDLPRLGAPADAASVGEGYLTLLGLISHEYFHTWNVKRLKPAEFASIDWQRENHTRLLWFFEGFTSYYDDLLLRRAGLIDDNTYLKLLCKSINQVQQAPGRHAQSVAQASFDAWVRYYRPDENTPNSTISYYSKGALVALCLDLSLRQQGAGSLDDTMRTLWQRCQGGPLTEEDIAQALHTQAGRSFARELADWVHGTSELPLERLLTAQGVRVRHEPSQLAQTLGLRVNDSGGAIVLKTVLAGSPAEQAGMAAGDEWLGLEVPPPRRRGPQRTASESSAWRLSKLDDVPLYAGNARAVTALIARDKRLLRLPLALPATSATTWQLQAAEPAQAGPWPGR
ncbi:MAG: peptidase M61 [Pseudomonadota bacterium]|nr:peptidase M61 [Pseudomonadota bacterium]